ncbi:RAMP superfamily CRISPR-associated protein [Promicromonospora sp. NPDC057138]|uniref:RAMP superfamily CRISPR-associated protein n=1 Tax=Promicromonospora sp. NPDC057138 TaxID=3346031 RepID=UPI00362AD3CD
MPGSAEHRSDRFINPYTFVSFAAEGSPEWRFEPAGHAKLGKDRFGEDRYSGTIDATITARSPLLIRNVDAEGDGAPRRVFEGQFDGGLVPYLPGSSLAGAVRSLHETITGGCLRVFNADFRPGYRDQVVRRRGRWRLARVSGVDVDGRPTRLNVCDRKTIRIDHAALLAALKLGVGRPVLPASGICVLVAPWARQGNGLGPDRVEDPAGLKVVIQAADVPRGEQPWAVLVTEPTTRTGAVWWTAGQLSHDRDVVLAEGAWESYLYAVAGSDDVVKKRSSGNSLVEVSKEFTETDDNGLETEVVKVGRRHIAQRGLVLGQMVWVECDLLDDATTEIFGVALSTVWRHSPADTAADRVPEHYRACHDMKSLCPSCRIFGAVKVTGRDATAGQHAYRGHVRFGDGIPMKAYPFQYLDLPPLGQPRPGAGQFYLDRIAADEAGAAPEPNGLPLREWGSTTDDRQHRNLRGRKRYWLTGEPSSRQYFRATYKGAPSLSSLTGDDNAASMHTENVPTIPSATRFTVKVSFDGLSLAEIGSLACALDPHPLFPDAPADHTYGSSVGGGRPLGFGTITTAIDALQLDTAASRYLGDAQPSITLSDAVSAFTADLRLSEARRIQLEHVLRLGFVPDDLVWYPPAKPLARGSEHLTTAQIEDLLKPGFPFWEETSGARLKKSVRSLRQLPLAESPVEAQTMPVITEKQK